MDFAISGGTIIFMLIVAVINFVILYFVIRAAVRDGQIEAHKYIHDDSPDAGDDDNEIYKLHQQLNNNDESS